MFDKISYYFDFITEILWKNKITVVLPMVYFYCYSEIEIQQFYDGKTEVFYKVLLFMFFFAFNLALSLYSLRTKRNNYLSYLISLLCIYFFIYTILKYIS